MVCDPSRREGKKSDHFSLWTRSDLSSLHCMGCRVLLPFQIYSALTIAWHTLDILSLMSNMEKIFNFLKWQDIFSPKCHLRNSILWLWFLKQIYANQLNCHSSWFFATLYDSKGLIATLCDFSQLFATLHDSLRFFATLFPTLRKPFWIWFLKKIYANEIIIGCIGVLSVYW